MLGLVAELNADDTIDGILVQSPLPPQIDEPAVMRSIEPVKDVDGLHPLNAGQLAHGRPTLVPATPLGVMALLAEYDAEGACRRDRAERVGRHGRAAAPAGELDGDDVPFATVDLAAETLNADVLVVAAGRAALVTADMVKVGAAVVDVGQNKTEAGLVGDVDAASAERASVITPVPGGVGPMTIAMLLQNTVRASRFRRGARVRLEPANVGRVVASSAAGARAVVVL